LAHSAHPSHPARHLTLAVIAACLAWPSGAQALSGPAAIAALNAQRAANGIPADLVERREWTAACRAHNHYMQLNNVFDPVEDRHRRGYTNVGAWAGTHGVLAWGTWTAGRNPWENAPLGLMPLLSPLLTQLGISSSYQHVCATTTPGYQRPAPRSPVLYSYPGDGAAGVAYKQWSYGLPVTPGDFVGLPAGFTTGPNLLVMADIGGTARMAGASLVGPSGPVAIRTVDNTVDGLGSYLPTGGVIIPAEPLAPGAAYRAEATMVIGGVTLSRAWTFTTGLADPNTQLFVSAFLSYDAATRRVTQGRVSVKTSSPAPVHVSFGGGESRDLANGETWTPPQTPGTFSVCAHQEPSGPYRGFDRCLPLTIRDAASFSHATTIDLKAALAGRMLRYKFAVHPPRGRKLTLRTQRSAGGRWKTFRTVRWDADRSITRTITARDSDAAVRVVASVPRVRLGAEVYRAATIVKTIRR
jgi:hypothetical protein